MKNTVDEIIFKIESAHRWNQFQGKRGRFIKGNPGRGMTKYEKNDLASKAISSMEEMINNFNTYNYRTKVDIITKLIKIKSLNKDNPEQLLQILMQLMLRCISQEDILKLVVNYYKKKK